MTEKQSGYYVEVLSDRGGEYTSKLWDNIYNEYGIINQPTTSYTEHQNGLSEKKNRTILNMVRRLLKAKYL